MVTKIYAVYDQVAQLYSKPFIMMEKVAARNFNYMARKWEDEECEDRVIKQIGEFEDTTGIIVPMTPKTVYDLDNAHKSYKEENKENG